MRSLDQIKSDIDREKKVLDSASITPFFYYHATYQLYSLELKHTELILKLREMWDYDDESIFSKKFQALLEDLDISDPR